MQEMPGEVEHQRSVSCQVLVLGGSLQGMRTALDQAQLGHNVLLVSADTCLYSEISLRADYRPPTGLTRADRVRFFPAEVFDIDGFLHPDRLKLHGERLLISKGVKLLYACQCVGWEENQATVAHKSGLFRVKFGLLFDCRGGAPLQAPCYCLQYVHQGRRGQIQVRAAEDESIYFSALETLKRVFPNAEPARSGQLKSETEGIQFKPAAFKPIIPRNETYDVVVVGGGTSGAVAALHAARLGARTLLLEMNYCLGGTATIGGVSAYWFGNRGGASEEIDRAVAEVYRRSGLPRRPHIWTEDDVFLPDIKANVLLALCTQADATIRMGSTVCGITKESGRVTGVRYAQEGALHSASCRMLIDCTGDGDCCVFAGADSIYGNEKDEMTYWASLAQYTSSDNYRNNFSAMVRVDDPFDYTRFIMAGRLRGEELYDHGQYVAVRESRHIRGLETITLEGILSMQGANRPLYTCFSNYDPKGRITADIVYFGLLPPNQVIQIPRGAVIPVDKQGNAIPGILIGGKAISCTHDAFPGVRMQPDLQQQGLALGVLAVQCLKQNADAWDLADIDEQIMGSGGILLDLPQQEVPDLQALIDALDGEEALEWLDADPTTYEKRVQPITNLFLAQKQAVLAGLQKAYEMEGAGKRRLLLSRLLLWHGDDRGTQDLIAEISARLHAAPGLPRRSGSVRYGQMLPDHGLMPEAVYLLNSLARSRDADVVPLFENVLQRLTLLPRDWRDLRAGIYCYIESFAYVARHRGDAGFVPLLMTLCDLDEFRSTQSDDLLAERLGMLKIALYDALWCLGDEYGRLGLEEMSRDNRLALAIAARRLMSSSAVSCPQ